jgi:uncharacterized membrane protein YqjE
MNKKPDVPVHMPYLSYVNPTGGGWDTVITVVALVVIAAIAVWAIRKSRRAARG